jgi:uncharacterized protein YkwD
MRIAIACLGLCACVGEVIDGNGGGGGDIGGDIDAAPSGTSDAAVDPSAADAAPGSPDAAPVTTPDAPPGTPSICARWNADRADIAEGTWSGSIDGCSAGDISASGRANALRLVNLYRFMAGLPPVTTDPEKDAKAQACALMMDANDQLSHDPPESWRCYSAPGAEAAGSSNISSGRGVGSVDLYMVDPGNPTTMGHRRWILSNGLGPIGLGSTSGSSCMWVFGGRGGGDRTWTAWPPPGDLPVQAVKPSFASIDETGWTVQSQSINLDGATVTVTAGGAARPVTKTVLQQNFGARYAISFIPQGWTTQAGTTYHVALTGISEPIEYDVRVVDCGQ